MKCIPLLILLLLPLSACVSTRLATSEKAMIHSAGFKEPLRVLSVFEPLDSLVLRTPAKPVRRIVSDDIEMLEKRMYASVQHPDSKGVGIAAPQVGISRQMILVQRFDKKEEPFESIFNPIVLAYSKHTTTYKEGCLSIPGYRGPVVRPDTITVKYRNKHGKKIKEEVSGFTARIFLHEIDHLRGILYTDYLNSDSLLIKTD